MSTCIGGDSMILNFRFSKNDAFEANNQSRVIDFSDSKSFQYTFWNNRNRLPHWYSRQGLDLLYISMAVFAADRLCLRANADDGWSRNFKMFIPVLECDLWNRAKTVLEEMLGFLSGDKWEFEFRKREESENELRCLEKWKKSKNPVKEYDQLCMFSGGLDSFIGAIDLLEEDMGKTLFVSHYGGGKGTKEFQDVLKDQFVKKYSIETRDFYQYYAKVVAGVEDTTRTRSFMFFAHAIALATSFERPINLIVPENGFISLNIPSTFSRIGTSSTRTTHPHYMSLLKDLLDIIEIPVSLINPYQFKTKGEMLIECKNQEFLQTNLENTMSCSHPDNGRRLKEKEARHCGYCLPCVIRQAAIKRAKLYDNSSYRDSKLENVKVAKTCLNSYRLGLKRYDPRYAFMTIQLSGPIVNDIDDYTDLYKRGMEELRSYLEEI